MGFKTRGSSNTKFVRIIDGNFVVPVDKGEEGAKKRILAKGPNAGKPTYELHFSGYEGYLVGAKIKEGKFGDELCLSMYDPTNEEYPFVVISVHADGRHAKSFFARMNNISLKKKLNIAPWKMEKKDRKTGKIIPGEHVHGWTLYQDEEKIDPSFDLKDVPEGEQIKKGGKITWDFSEQTEFFLDEFQKWLNDAEFKKVDHDKIGKSTPKKTKHEDVDDEDDDEDEEEDEEEEDDEEEEEEEEVKPKKKDKGKKKKKNSLDDEDDDDVIPF